MLAATLYTFGVVGFLCLCAGYATGRDAADLTLLGLGHSEAARAGGETRDDPFSHAAYGDWPFVPADLKIPVHGRRFGS